MRESRDLAEKRGGKSTFSRSRVLRGHANRGRRSSPETGRQRPGSEKRRTGRASLPGAQVASHLQVACHGRGPQRSPRLNQGGASAGQGTQQGGRRANSRRAARHAPPRQALLPREHLTQQRQLERDLPGPPPLPPPSDAARSPRPVDALPPPCLASPAAKRRRV